MIPSDPPEFNRPTAHRGLKPRHVNYRKPVFYAVYFPYGRRTKNTLGVSAAEIANGAGGEQVDVVTSFLHRSERDRYVATDPEHIAVVPSRDLALRRELRSWADGLQPCICEGEYRQDCPVDECPAYLEAQAAKEVEEIKALCAQAAALEAEIKALDDAALQQEAEIGALMARAAAEEIAGDLAYDAAREADRVNAELIYEAWREAGGGEQ